MVKGSSAAEAGSGQWHIAWHTERPSEQHVAPPTDQSASENWTVVVSNSTLVSPEEAQRLLERGYTYVDVRSESEFVVGHPAGAVNVPLQHVEGDRLVDSPEFIALMSERFRTTDPLVIGCRSGSRSRVAIMELEQAGFATLAELRHGFLGARDAFGRRLPGWVQAGLPVERGRAEDSASARRLARVRGMGQG